MTIQDNKVMYAIYAHAPCHLANNLIYCGRVDLHCTLKFSQVPTDPPTVTLFIKAGMLDLCLACSENDIVYTL